MQMFATCPVHGRVPVSSPVGGNASIRFKNTATNCPYCGRPSVIENGVYDIVQSVVRAFRAEGVTREQVDRLKAVAEQVQAGTLSKPAATDQIATLNPAIQALWKWLNESGQAISVLLAIIGIYISIIALNVAIESSRSDDAAAAEQLKATQTQNATSAEQLAEARLQTDLIAKIVSRLPAQVTPTDSVTQPARIKSRVPAAPNRHERRKAARQAKQKAKPIT